MILTVICMATLMQGVGQPGVESNKRDKLQPVDDGSTLLMGTGTSGMMATVAVEVCMRP